MTVQGRTPLHLVRKIRDDFQGIITRERNSGGLQLGTRTRKVFDPEREVVEGGSDRPFSCLRSPEEQEDAGEFQDLERTAGEDLRAEVVDFAARGRTAPGRA